MDSKPIGAAKDALDEGIKMSNEDNILWCFIHQSIKREAMSKTECGSIRAVAKQVYIPLLVLATNSMGILSYIDLTKMCAITWLVIWSITCDVTIGIG
jgi:hypothetical protein